MKKPFSTLGFVVVLGAAACHPQAGPPASSAAVTAVVPSVTAVAALEMTPDLSRFLVQYDLAELWQPAADGRVDVMNGFLGPDHYRLQVVLLSARKDKQQPNVYHVTGKSRFKDHITPFIGTITLRRVTDLTTKGGQAPMGPEANAFTAVGTYAFREEPSRWGAGTFSGKLAVDFFLDLDRPGKLRLFTISTDATAASPTRDAACLFEGTWRGHQSREQKPASWAINFLPVVSEVLENFNIGERDVNINPKYAKLGWDEYWTNDEWWTEPGTITAGTVDTSRVE